LNDQREQRSDHRRDDHHRRGGDRPMNEVRNDINLDGLRQIRRQEITEPQDDDRTDPELGPFPELCHDG
jgi:hypothetical protein